MTDLLSRLSAATGPSRELDAEIALANGWIAPSVQDKMSFYSDASNCWRGPVGQIEVEPPRYTESIDAALYGEDIIGTSEQSARPGQPVKWMAIQRMPKGRMPVSAIAHTEAIARRLACLKAKEESKP